MVENPERQVEQFAQAGAGIITVHMEACAHIHRVVNMVKETGCRAGVSINPATPVSVLEDILDEADLVLLMTVNPGYSAQKFIESTVGKIARLHTEVQKRKLRLEIEVDGGINCGTAARVVAAGADVLVAGAAVFSSGLTVAEAIARLRSSARSPAA
jgi:ribulose-phosphate 3-epimerase